MTDRERMIKGAAPDASGEDPREKRLEAMFAADDPTVEPSEALQRRVAEIAAQHQSRGARRGSASRSTGRRWTPWRIGLGLAAATALAFIGVGLAPMWVAAQVLRRAEAAAGAVQNAHVVIWRVAPDGSRTKSMEEWEQGRSWRAWDLDGQRTRLLSGGKLWIYEPTLNKVTVQALASTHEPSGYTLKEFVHDFARHGWRDQIRMTGDTIVNGQRVHQVAIERAGWRERSLVSVDAATDLLIQGEWQREVDGQWITQSSMEFRYNEPLPADLFAARFPKSAQVFDLDRGQQEWGQRLARVIARQQVGDRTIAIRDVQVNAEGDLFLLYTAGKHPDDEFKTGNHLAGRDWNIEVKDDLGTFYEWQQGGDWAYNRTMPVGSSKGYVFNGERLHGDWWIPAVPQNPWKPRRITLTFRVNPVNLHGGYNDPERKAVYTETAVFPVTVPRPATLLVPDYMPYMAIGIGKEEDIRISHAKARAFYYRYEQPDLPRALDYYREVIRLDEVRAREAGQPSFDSETWRDIGTVLRELGRKEEARAALEEAVREATYPGGVRQQAEEALAALKGDVAWSVGRPAPSFTATDLNGQAQSPERYRGQVLLIDLWATWDDSTRADLPTLKALHAQYSGKGLAILGIGLDYDAAAFRKFVKERALPWPQVCDSNGQGSPLGRSFGSPKPPRTILIDRQGAIRAVDLHGPALEKAVAALLASG